MSTFPIITHEVQKDFEASFPSFLDRDSIPSICGYCGRGCYQMDKTEGANRRTCTYCALAEFADALRKEA